MNEPGGPRPVYEAGTEWLRGDGDAADVVMSSRARLARNLAGFPFVSRATREQRQRVLDLCRSRLLAGGFGGPGAQVMWVDLAESPTIERTLLVERHLMSQQHSRGKQSSGSGGAEEPRGLAVALPDERLSVMVNEEDHLRLQCIRSGLALEAVWAEIDALDDSLEQGLEYAYSPRWGYLTGCPTNVGSGARFSVMLHLPALRMIGNIEKVKRAAADMSLAVRGFYGEGSDAAGDFYQISNQTTLGKPEQVLLDNLQREILPKVIEYERMARKTLIDKRRLQLEDQVCRAVGLLGAARLLTTEESMQLLSQLRLGVVTGIISDVEPKVVNQLMLLAQPAHLQRVIGREMDQEHRRAARAELIRSRLSRDGNGRVPKG
ncbi:MAG: protein arginine kinase [Phycisphaerales bacterium]|nr:protein arginine kinase [Phycisphaerales bacterium]